MPVPFCAQDLGYIGVPPAGHALWAEVGGGITCVTSGENAWQLIKLPKITVGSFIKGKPKMPALAGQPSLLGYYDNACMVYWNGEIAGQNILRPFFPLLGFSV